ncbi:MAG: ATP-dependent DNA helicase RecG [Flavobacteriales bacterium]|jgi:ATP-dependent DNA helicase RecG|uniref:ATP-dependent DNA helicase RecG n=1 Tax=Blattabacterium sp. (Mastotermes darwiniensis) TaxID=39768 RepID=UPI000231DEC6|nr:ATP-dependent DNA helicase RecG [Blattabacterium sp. (Mastotermes darwiniensis)]AER40762.1 ATP-dependent DNA helicase [Blattabacterium sp. (Mastotermes darwiniensis) str. MADAR]MDR1804605.1 ATP-dependent DNA helicase RecG [Flavobacteriales bacterium]
MSIIEKPIEHLKGLSSKKARLLNIELNIHTYQDLLFFYPKKYAHIPILENVSKFKKKNYKKKIQVSGKITKIQEFNYKKRKILIAHLENKTGFIELIWFRKTNLFKRSIKKNIPLIVCGNIKYFQQKIQIIHPYIQKLSKKNISIIHPIYPISKKLKEKGINNSFIMNLLKNIIEESKEENIEEIFLQDVLMKQRLMKRKEALIQIHFPKSFNQLFQAQYRLKFEELFFFKLSFLYKKDGNTRSSLSSYPFSKLGKNFYKFYKYFLPFPLTEEQKKVLKEIRHDLKKPIQMNRLLQGDVGCGKTIIAVLSMLIALDNGFQSCLMVPTEVLAIQHYYYIQKMFSRIGIRIALLTGGTSIKIRKCIYNDIFTGKILILIGTHTLIQKTVQFKNLGLAIIDEQQRFGVEQRDIILENHKKKPHILIMTATPIPRTLSMTISRNLNISIIKKLPMDRKPIKTIHFLDRNRSQVFKLINNQIIKGRQIYIIYPTIDKCKKNEYQNLMTGYQIIKEKFKNFKDDIGILHGKMKYKEKNIQMDRFLHGKTKIMVSTTVIEVGVDVPNASVILIENADCFGLSQLHQLRGRVGRGPHQSYCILMTNNEISMESRFRIKVMCQTNDGLEIAKKDLQLRGSGDLIGTKQSGKSYLRIANIIKDYRLMKEVIPIAKNFFLSHKYIKKNFYNNYKYLWEKSN